MNYIQRNIKVLAYKLTREVEDDCPEWLRKPLQDEKIEIDRAIVDGAVRVYGCTVRTPEGKMRAKAGDYIIMEPDGSLRICKNSHFGRLYQKVKE